MELEYLQKKSNTHLSTETYVESFLNSGSNMRFSSILSYYEVLKYLNQYLHVSISMLFQESLK